MKRVATVTLDGYFNYGNVLQRYALCKVLSNAGCMVDSLWHFKEADFIEYLAVHYVWMQKNWSWKTYVKLAINWKGCTSKLLAGQNAWESARCAVIKSFVDRYIPMRYGVDFAHVADEYDYIVTGSDQVWNPYFAKLKEMFITFAPPEKRIAYAASISAPEIPSDKLETFIAGINGMKKISVREQAGADLIRELTGRSAEVVADPTMLLTAEEWRRIARKPGWLSDDEAMLVTYFLGKRPKDVIERIARENNLQVVNMLDENIFEHYAVAPEEWLWLIDHARLMYTDSFHGTVFSILFRTPFVVTERVGEGCANKMTSRIDTLLEKFDLADRRGTAKNKYTIASPLTIRYGEAEAVLRKGRQKADAFMREALEIDI